jgi:hypothetical protein
MVCDMAVKVYGGATTVSRMMQGEGQRCKEKDGARGQRVNVEGQRRNNELKVALMLFANQCKQSES